MIDRKYQLVIVGFPKCGTTALMRAFEADPEIQVVRTPSSGLEIQWPSIRELAPSAGPGRILAHKYAGYIYSHEALTYLRDCSPTPLIVLCIRDPRSALLSWHNMHRRIATSGKSPEHFAWKERDFYKDCSISAYYEHFAKKRLRYDDYLLKLLDVIPVERLWVLSQESLANNMDSIVDTLKDSASGTFYPVPAASGDTARHIGFADRAQDSLSELIEQELAQTNRRLHEIIADNGVMCSVSPFSSK
jgi:hypothetical protein